MKYGHALLSLFGSNALGRVPRPSLLGGLILTAFALGCGDDASSSGSGSGGNGEGASGAGGQAQGGSPDGGGGQAQGGSAQGGGGQAQGGEGGGGAPVSMTPEVACAGSFTCARLEMGIKCWGFGVFGQLGQPTESSSIPVPADIEPIDLGGSAISLGVAYEHACATLNTGAVRCWGNGANGRLGYGNTDDIGDNETPAEAGDVDVGGKVVQVALGDFHTCALLDTGAVRCWGSSYPILGYGNDDNVGDDEAPASAGDVDVGGKVVQIAAGNGHTCALLDTGAVRCWGRGGSGALGYPNYDNVGDDETPAEAGDVDVGGRVVQIAAGWAHTCALLDTGSVRCWGDGSYGKLGYGSSASIRVPSSAGDVDVGGIVVQIAAGVEHTCAVLDTGTVRCWGLGDGGRLGYGDIETIGDDETPASAGDVDVGGTVVHLAAGLEHTCAVLDTDAVRCWGESGWSKLGYGNYENIGDDETPASAGDVPL